MMNTMRTTIDGAGRVVVPKPLRERLHVTAGAAVEIEEHDGVIEIRPVAADVEIVQTPEGPVAATSDPRAVLTGEEVRQTLEHVRQ